MSRSLFVYSSMSNSSTPTTANITSHSHTSPPIPSRRIDHETIHPDPSLLSLPTHETVSSSSRPPKKRSLRIKSENMTLEQASSPSDTSSQSGMADNETEAERSQQSELSAPALPALKKKRTRTLTTPHQSAVLHALLAKSRFPTTAMREEVGRQIGLSARKVQIWFQNQRQKARRPQSDSTPLSRPPQFGPFSSLPPSTSSQAASISEQPSPDTPEGSASRTPVPGSGGSLNPALSGPGIPGQRMSPYPSSAEEYPHHAPASPELPIPTTQLSSHRVVQEFPSLTLREPARLLAPRPFLMHDSQLSPPSSRVLPPINSSALESCISTDPNVPSTTSFRLPQTPATAIHRYFSASNHTEHPISAALGISPPFALQPQPQWDSHSFIPYTRPDFVSFSSSAARGRISIPGTHDRPAPHVSPQLGARMEYYASPDERLRPLSSQAHPSTLRATVDSSSGLTPTGSNRLLRPHDPREYHAQPPSPGDGVVHSDDNRSRRDH